MDYFQVVPTEIIEEILLILDPSDLSNFLITKKYFVEIADGEFCKNYLSIKYVDKYDKYYGFSNWNKCMKYFTKYRNMTSWLDLILNLYKFKPLKTYGSLKSKYNLLYILDTDTIRELTNIMILQSKILPERGMYMTLEYHGYYIEISFHRVIIYSDNDINYDVRAMCRKIFEQSGRIINCDINAPIKNYYINVENTILFDYLETYPIKI